MMGIYVFVVALLYVASDPCSVEDGGAKLCLMLTVQIGTQSVELAKEVQDHSIFKDSKMSRNLLSATSDIGVFQLNSGIFIKPECTLRQRLEVGFRRVGRVLGSVTVRSGAERCALNCAISRKQCVAINYDRTRNMCFYLRSVNRIVSDSDFTTALLSPSFREICSVSNVITGYNRGSSGLPGNPHILDSAVECCSLCYITEGCLAYDYMASSNECYLRNSITGVTPSRASSTGIVCPFVFS